MGWPAFSSDFMPGYTHWPETNLGRKKKNNKKNNTAANARYSLFFFVSPSPRHATGLFMGRKTLTDRHASTAISSKLIVADWSVIVVGDRVLSSLVLVVPEWCPEGGREGWKDGGRAVINTDRGESVLVWGITTGVDWHGHTGSAAGSGQRDTEGSGLKERL